MKNTIFYYTGTGNSLHAAKRSAEALGGAELVHMGRRCNSGYKAINIGVVGFVFPVYAWGPPIAVEKFLKNLDIPKPHYTFTILTHGGWPGDTLSMWDDMLSSKGFCHDAGWALRAVENYVPLYNPPAPHKQSEINTLLDARLNEVCTQIRNREKQPITGSFLGKFARYVIHPLWAMQAARSDRNWRVSEKCTGCGICAKVCPVGNITMIEATRPRWNHTCEQCMACFHWCPEKAITWGKKGAAYHHYHHPAITATDLFPDNRT